MKGVPLKAVQELLGHSSIETTMIYAHLSPDSIQSAVQVLDQSTAEQKKGHCMGTMLLQ
jgi:site-specific recombinase XerD